MVLRSSSIWRCCMPYPVASWHLGGSTAVGCGCAVCLTRPLRFCLTPEPLECSTNRCWRNLPNQGSTRCPSIVCAGCVDLRCRCVSIRCASRLPCGSVTVLSPRMERCRCLAVPAPAAVAADSAAPEMDRLMMLRYQNIRFEINTCSYSGLRGFASLIWLNLYTARSIWIG